MPAYNTTDEILPILIPAVMRDLVSLVAQSVLYGCYLVCVATTLYHLLNPRKRQGRRVGFVIAVTLVMFVISTFHWASHFAVLIRRLRIVFLRTDGTISSRITRANLSTVKLLYLNDILFLVLYITGDAAMACRVFILQDRAAWPTAVMALLWAGSLGTGLGFVGCIAHKDLPARNEQLCTRLQTASWLVSLLLNGVVACFLAQIARTHKRSVRVLGLKTASLASQTLNVLATAGFAYVLLGLPRMTQFANQSRNPLPTAVSFANEVIGSMLLQLVGLYPTCVSAVLFYTARASGDPSITAADTSCDAVPLALGPGHRASALGDAHAGKSSATISV
ncbi:hypothetical protein AURDEDRAFT_166940 [Auricularia subglabra TFB-10046 SS5]|nr:hypothetical protein AURDEDRAFT_166940 [Auricularia subglabra TFB-10046 SS5]